jgi:hypothetical protein
MLKEVCREVTRLQLNGTTDQFPLRELIEMIVYSSVTGALELRLGEQDGRLFFYDGRPYHAAVGDETGLDAVCRLFEARNTSFRFAAGHTVTDESLWLDPWEMIERAEYQAAQWQQVRPHIPNMSWVPALRSSTAAEHIHIDESTWPVLAAVDGQRTITAIAESLGMEPLSVCIALVRLLQQDLVAVRAPRPGLLEPRPLASQAAAQPPPQTNGFFDRLLAQAQSTEAERRPDLTEEEPADQQRSNRYVNDRYINRR